MDSALLDRIVRDVMRDLNLSQAAAPGSAPSSPPSPTTPQQSSPASSQSSSPRPTGSVQSLTGSVITAQALEQLSDLPKVLHIPAKSLLTPSAHDWLKKHNVELRRGESSPSPSVSKSAGIQNFCAYVVRVTPALEKCLAELASNWKRELLGCPDDAAKLAIAALTRGELAGAAIFAAQAHRAACFANRNEKVRAAVANSAADIKSIASQMRLNVICVDPTNRSWFELNNIFKSFRVEDKVAH